MRLVAGGEILREFRRIPGMMVVSVPRGSELETADALSVLPFVRYAHPNYIGYPCASPNDPSYPQQWGLKNTGQTVNGVTGTAHADICAESGWNTRTDAPDIIVAILDSGVNYLHEDLAENMWTNPGEVPGDNDGNGYVDDVYGIGTEELVGDDPPGTCNPLANWGASDPYESHTCLSFPDNKTDTESGSHGTAIAGIIGAVGDNDQYVSGVAWSARILALRVHDDSNICAFHTLSSVGEAFDYALDKGAHILNCSWYFPEHSQGLEDLFKEAHLQGRIAVVAAGNWGTDIDDPNEPADLGKFPASYTYSSMLVVGATDQNGDRAEWIPGFQESNWGATSVDLFAPGTNIVVFPAATFFNSFCLVDFLDGTSFAAPHAAGACALVWQEHPTWTATQVVAHVIDKVEKRTSLTGICVSEGMLNLGKALSNSCVRSP